MNGPYHRAIELLAAGRDAFSIPAGRGLPSKRCRRAIPAASGSPRAICLHRVTHRPLLNRDRCGGSSWGSNCAVGRSMFWGQAETIRALQVRSPGARQNPDSSIRRAALIFIANAAEEEFLAEDRGRAGACSDRRRRFSAGSRTGTIPSYEAAHRRIAAFLPFWRTTSPPAPERLSHPHQHASFLIEAGVRWSHRSRPGNSDNRPKADLI